MEVYFNRTSAGFKHTRAGKACQDHSVCYRDSACTILTVCDGHGGELYIRSDRGARFASAAAVSVLRRHALRKPPERYPDELVDRIKLELLCEWNRLVEEDIDAHPFSKEELCALSPGHRFELERDSTLAYGTTLHAACITEALCCCVSIGDGGIFCVSGGRAEYVFPDDDSEPVANMTYSLSSEDAYGKLRVTFLIMSDEYVSGVVLCTDGATNPYISYDNFTKAFLMPIVKRVRERGEDAVPELEAFVDELGASMGTGDDVSVALYYRRGSDGYKSGNGGAVCKRGRKSSA